MRRSLEQGELVVSLKSVNHRGLDLHFHLPPEFDRARERHPRHSKNGVARGHVQIHLSYVRAGAQAKRRSEP